MTKTVARTSSSMPLTAPPARITFPARTMKSVPMEKMRPSTESCCPLVWLSCEVSPDDWRTGTQRARSCETSCSSAPGGLKVRNVVR